MKIVNPKLSQEILEKRPIKIDLGCGVNARKGFYAVDHLDMDGIDIVADLNQPLHLLPDNCCEHIYSRHSLEHVKEFIPLMREIHRIARPGATIEIIVPHFSNVYGYSDPTHVRLFGLYSMYYFVSQQYQPKVRKVPDFYTKIRFRMKSLSIQFYDCSLLDKIFAPIFTRFVNFNESTQDFYERRLAFIFHAWQIRYLMEPEK